MNEFSSKNMRDNPLFMRNNYTGRGKWNIHLVKKQEINAAEVSLLACSDTKPHDRTENASKGVHFFVDDYRFNGIYNNPERSLSRYAQYAFYLRRIFPPMPI